MLRFLLSLWNFGALKEKVRQIGATHLFGFSSWNFERMENKPFCVPNSLGWNVHVL